MPIVSKASKDALVEFYGCLVLGQARSLLEEENIV